MHKYKEFTEMKKASDSCQYLVDKYEKAYKPGATVDEVAAIIADIREDLNRSGFISAREYSLSPSFYTTADGTACSSVGFTIKPTSKAAYNTPVMKNTFSLAYGEKFIPAFIDALANWFDKCRSLTLLYDNLAELNAVFAAAIELGEIPFTVSFDIGSGILAASDGGIVLGISDTLLMELSNAPAFNDEMADMVREDYIKNLADFFKSIPQPYLIVKQNHSLIKPLGIFSRRTVRKMLRENVATRRIEYVRTGHGFHDTDDYFCVVAKTPCTAEEAEQFKRDGKTVIENKNASKSEKAKGLTSILVDFLISPFNDMGVVDVAVKDVPGVFDANA